jgi:hypothetical protein
MRTGPSRRLLAGAAALATALAGSLVVLTAAPVGALTVFTVDSAADGAPNAANCTPVPVPGGCRLRDAFAAANATADDVQINVTPGLGTITLSAGSLDYSPAAAHALTLAGNGVAIVQPGSLPGITGGGSATGITVDRVSLTSGFSGINPGTVPLTVTNSSITAIVTQILTVAQGIFSSGPVIITSSTITATEGAGSNATAVAVTAAAAIVTDSQITASGAISNDARVLSLNGAATVSVTGSQLTAIHAGGLGGGFGIISGGTAPVTVTTSTIRAGGGGFGVQAAGATLTLDRSTVTGGGQGGVSMFGNGAHTATLTNSTVTDNPGTGVSAAVIELVYSTVTNNATFPAQVNLNTPTLNTFGSVIARPGAGNANCSAGGATSSTGYNYSDDPDATTSCKLANATDRIGASNNPLLGALADNGGPTVTRLPQTGSPLIDQIPAASPCAGVNVVIDQRGLPRPTTAGTFCDIGAVEVQPTTAILLAPDFAG